MSILSDEILNAFLDGELPEAERERVAAALASDAGLAARFAQLQQANAALKQAWPGEDRDLPAGIRAAMERLAAAQDARVAVAGQGNVIALDTRRARAGESGSQVPSRSRWQRWSLAASILAVVGVGLLLTRQTGDAPIAWMPAAGAVLPADHPVARTLSETASGTARDWPDAASRTGTVYPVLSFRDGQGDLCREFELADQRSVAVGVACREPAGWRVEGIAAAQGRSTVAEGYVPVSGNVPDEINALVDRLMQGTPLDATAEAAALGAVVPRAQTPAE